jgi:chromate transporter
MISKVPHNLPESEAKKLKEIAVSCLKLGTIGFGGIAGMVATIENEMVGDGNGLIISISWTF